MSKRNHKLIVGLGNPGEEYVGSRHNAGFWFVEMLARKAGLTWRHEQKVSSEVSEGNLPLKHGSIEVILAKPQLFVNNSGQTVKKIKLRYKAAINDIIIVHDDLDIAFGKIKLSYGASSAGHRGVQSIIRSLGTKNFYRLRIGTANIELKRARQTKNDSQRITRISDFVTSPFSKSERAALTEVFAAAIEKLTTLR